MSHNIKQFYVTSTFSKQKLARLTGMFHWPSVDLYVYFYNVIKWTIVRHDIVPGKLTNLLSAKSAKSAERSASGDDWDLTTLALAP